jgi:hypothetical protein
LKPAPPAHPRTRHGQRPLPDAAGIHPGDSVQD